MCTPQPVGAPSAIGCSGLGGMQVMGTAGQIQTQDYEEKPSFTANATWIHGNHTIKGGAEVYIEGVLDGSFAGVTLATGIRSDFGTLQSHHRP